MRRRATPQGMARPASGTLRRLCSSRARACMSGCAKSGKVRWPVVDGQQQGWTRMSSYANSGTSEGNSIA